MAATALTDRYAANLHGVLSCYDRIIVTGTLPGACYAGGMTSFLYARGIRIFDYPRFAEPLRERIRARAQQVCEAAGVQIEHVNKSHVRKEDLVARVLARHQLSVQLAKVSTLGERVEDTFLVQGSELQNNFRQIEIETELLHALSE